MAEIYDIILIQSPLYKNIEHDSQNMKIEYNYWKTMEQCGGMLLGDLPTEASYGILSIASYLEKKYRVKILDFHLMDYCQRKERGVGINEKIIQNELSKYKSLFVGISVMTVSDEWANTITNIMRNLFPQVYIFWGGYYPTQNYENILNRNSNIDFIVKYEGELAIEMILDYQKNKDSFIFKELNNIVFKSEHKIVNTPDNSFINDINILPPLNYDLYEAKYRDMLIPRIYTTRGCENSCIYCTANNSQFRIMKKAGCIQIALGIESNNEDALREVNKELLTSTSLNACKMVKEFDIQIQAYIMIGLPNDNLDSCISTLKFIGELVKDGYIDVTHLSVMVPYPGSILYDERNKYDLEILDDNPNHYYMNCDFLGAQIPNYNTRNLTSEEIYALWLYGLSYFTKCYLSKNEKGYFHQLYRELQLDNISLLDSIVGNL